MRKYSGPNSQPIDCKKLIHPAQLADSVAIEGNLRK